MEPMTRMQAVEWWEAHSNVSPTLLLVCGVDKCPKVVGEVKESGATTLVLLYTVLAHGPQLVVERNTEGWPTGAIADFAEIQEYRDGHKVRRNGLEVVAGEHEVLMKRHQEPGPPLVQALEDLRVFICSGDHRETGPGYLPAGVFPLDEPDAVVAGIRRLLADTTHGSKRRYVLFH